MHLFGQDKTPENLRKHFQAQKAPISWLELETFLKQGTVVKIAESLDLIEVAIALVLDDSKQVQQWMNKSLLARVDSQTEKVMKNPQEKINALVTSPWVIVQEIKK